jgi:hypothetical protein
VTFARAFASAAAASDFLVLMTYAAADAELVRLHGRVPPPARSPARYSPSHPVRSARLRRPDQPFRPLPQLPRDLDRRRIGEHQPRRFQEHLVLAGADLGLDDPDPHVPLVAGGEASDAVPNGLAASVGVQGSLLPEEGEPRWLGGGASLVIDRSSFFEIPDLETSDVHPNGPRAKAQRYAFHQQLVLGEDCVAGVARFAVAWSTPGRSDAVMRQATVLEFAPDDAMEDLLVHKARV